jgi:DUF971 family protein
MTTQTQPWPQELHLRDEGRQLHISFDNGQNFELSAEFLRVHSPSAEVRGHGLDEPILVYGKKNIAITSVIPTGNYAVRLVFSDGHETGIFTWTYLHELGLQRETYWHAYLNRLASKGLSR